LNYGVLLAFLFWFGSLSIFFIAVPTNIQEGTINYNFTTSLNTSEFNPDSEITGADVGVLTSLARFLGFVAFGFGLPDGTPFYVQVLVSILNTSMTLMFIAWIIGVVTGS